MCVFGLRKGNTKPTVLPQTPVLWFSFLHFSFLLRALFVITTPLSRRLAPPLDFWNRRERRERERRVVESLDFSGGGAVFPPSPPSTSPLAPQIFQSQSTIRGGRCGEKGVQRTAEREKQDATTLRKQRASLALSPQTPSWRSTTTPSPPSAPSPAPTPTPRPTCWTRTAATWERQSHFFSTRAAGGAVAAPRPPRLGGKRRQ